MDKYTQTHKEQIPHALREIVARMRHIPANVLVGVGLSDVLLSEDMSSFSVEKKCPRSFFFKLSMCSHFCETVRYLKELFLD